MPDTMGLGRLAGLCASTKDILWLSLSSPSSLHSLINPQRNGQTDSHKDSRYLGPNDFGVVRSKRWVNCAILDIRGNSTLHHFPP